MKKMIIALLFALPVFAKPGITGIVYLDYQIYEGAKVELLDMPEQYYRYDISDADGRYFIPLPHEGDWWIHCAI